MQTLGLLKWEMELKPDDHLIDVMENLRDLRDDIVGVLLTRTNNIVDVEVTISLPDAK